MKNLLYAQVFFPDKKSNQGKYIKVSVMWLQSNNHLPCLINYPTSRLPSDTKSTKCSTFNCTHDSYLKIFPDTIQSIITWVVLSTGLIGSSIVVSPMWLIIILVGPIIESIGLSANVIIIVTYPTPASYPNQWYRKIHTHIMVYHQLRGHHIHVHTKGTYLMYINIFQNLICIGLGETKWLYLLQGCDQGDNYGHICGGSLWQKNIG